MKIENSNIVRFSSHPRPFLLEDNYCHNPDCPCNIVFLSFREIRESVAPAPDPLSFRIRVDLEAWQEDDPPSRPQDISDCVQEFLEEFPEERKDELRKMRLRLKQEYKRLQDYSLDARDVVEGKMVSYADILHEEGAISSRGRAYAYNFLFEGHEYMIEDQYCPNPDCHCERICIEFWEFVYEEEGEDRGPNYYQGFLGSVLFDGSLELLDPGRQSREEANRALSAWWECYGDDLGMLRQRYWDVKEIGQRSLDDAAANPARTGTLSDEPTLLDEIAQSGTLLEEPAPEKVRVGRNDPCPCGSGKKYKKCCWRKGNADAD